MFDYEFAAVQHHVNCRLADAVVVPDAIPPERLYRYGARGKISAYPGPQGGVLPRRLRARRGGAARARVSRATARSSSCARRRSSRSTTVSPAISSARCSSACAPVCRRGASRWSCSHAPPSSAAGLSGYDELTLPERAIDAQSLVAYADLVISAGGTMNREAAALGTPVLSSFQGRMGALDERLIAEGRMRALRETRRSRPGAPLARRERRRATSARRAATPACSCACCCHPQRSRGVP